VTSKTVMAGQTGKRMFYGFPKDHILKNKKVVPVDMSSTGWFIEQTCGHSVLEQVAERSQGSFTEKTNRI